jgi:hypothetical protein
VFSDLEKFIDAAAKKLYCKLAYLLQGVDLIKKKARSNLNQILYNYYLCNRPICNCGRMWR